MIREGLTIIFIEDRDGLTIIFIQDHGCVVSHVESGKSDLSDIGWKALSRKRTCRTCGLSRKWSLRGRRGRGKSDMLYIQGHKCVYTGIALYFILIRYMWDMG
jgi:hypothetical protein